MRTLTITLCILLVSILFSNTSLFAQDFSVTGMQGTYYIGDPGTGPGGSNPEFSSFKMACDSLSSLPITGNCIFYITSNINEPNTGGVGVGLAVNPGTYTITFKPYTGKQPVITFAYAADGNVGPSGAFIMGIPPAGNITWDSMRTTKNIIIDGSNTAGGNTRDLTFQTDLTSHRNAILCVMVGDVSNITLKNCNWLYRSQGVSTSGNLFAGPIMIRCRNYLNVDWVPHDIMIDNNYISSNFDGVAQNVQGLGTYQTGTPYPLNYPSNITIKNNKIEGKRRCIGLYRAGNVDIFKNELITNQNIIGTTPNEGIYAADVDTGSVVNIWGNKFSKLSSMANGAGYGNTAISIETFGTFNIVNNMIYGFELTTANPTAYLTGIKNSSASAVVNCFFNSIYMNDIADIGTGAVAYNGILISNGTNIVMDNIVMTAEANFPTYCVNRTGTNGAFAANYNDYYAAVPAQGNIGFWNATATPTLAGWKTASLADTNSISVDPKFKTTTDLHLLNNASPVVAKGKKIAAITLDIDAELRDSIPELGCDEFPGFIPVEMTVFTASTNGKEVTLNWETATELNSKSFVIERRASGNDWKDIGEVRAAGNSTTKRLYSFVDMNAANGSLQYRLRTVDFDGSYSHSKVIEVSNVIPTAIELQQNYPNPFNPATIISYSLPSEMKVKIEVFSMQGELVAELVNGTNTAGTHNITFNAGKLASGTYIYQLTAGNTVLHKKLLLMK